MTRFSAWLFLIFSVAFGAPSYAGQWTSAHPRFDAIHFEGAISKATATEFDAMLLQYPSTRAVVLNSGGGNVSAALEIARKIDQLGLMTIVMKGEKCYSACSLIFFAGQRRYAVGELGVHQISGTTDSSITQIVVADIYNHLLTFGVHTYVLSAMFSTPSSQMYVLNEDEVIRYNVNRSGKAPSAENDVYSDKATFYEVATVQSNSWSSLLLRNKKNGHYLCALESEQRGVVLRLVNYMTKTDSFVELINSQLPLGTGNQKVRFEFRKKSTQPIIIEVSGQAEETDFWFDIQSEDHGLAFLVPISLANFLFVHSDDGRLLAHFDLTGSLRAAQAFSRCMTNS